MSFDSKNLIEEYRFCHEKVNNLEGHIWKTATIFGIGSITGILTLSRETQNQTFNPLLSIIVSLLAIGILLSWWRFANRWWSIQHAIIERMKEIELIMEWKINRYVCSCDEKVKEDKTDVIEQLLKDIRKTLHCINECLTNKLYNRTPVKVNSKNLPENYELRGIRPMIDFFIWVNIIAWIVIIIFQILPKNITIYDLLNHYEFSVTLQSITIFLYAILFVGIYCRFINND